MRKKFIYVVLIPLIVLLTVVYIFHNRWIESGIEYAAEEVVGAKVEIEGLQLHLSPLGIEWAKMQVANPNDTWKNLFETGKVNFKINFNQLLRGKYIIDLMEVEDVVVGTKRTTDGAIDKERNKRAILAGDKWTFSKLADDALKNTITSTPLFDIVKLKNGFNADSLVKALDMKTVKHLDTLKTKINDVSNQWSTLKNDFETQKAKVLDLEKQIEAINPSELNNVQSITNAIVTVDNATKTINEVSQLVNTRSASVQSNVQGLTSSLGMTAFYVKSDFEKLKSMAKLPSINTKGMAQILVGSEMYKRANAYLSWVDYARANVRKYQPQPEYEDPPRMKGQDIKFPTEHGYPKLWIKQIKISGGTDKNSSSDYISAHGEAKNISDNQQITGVPITVALDGTANNRTLKLAGVFDRSKAVPLDQISAALSGVPVGDFSLGNSNFLSTKITNAVMSSDVNVTVPGKNLDLKANFKLKNVTMQFESEPKNIVEQIAREVLTGINDLTVGMHLWNTDGPFDFELTTDLDEKLTQRVAAVMGQEIQKLQNELQNKFNSIVNEQISKFNQAYKSKIDEVQNQLGEYQSLFADKLNLVGDKKKELLAQLDKQKKGFLEDKLKDLLK